MRNASWIKIFVVTFSQTFVVQIHGTNVSFAKFFLNVIFHFFFFNGVTSIQDRSDDGVHVWLVEKRYGKPNRSRFIYHSMKRGLAAQCSKVRKIVQKDCIKIEIKFFWNWVIFFFGYCTQLVPSLVRYPKEIIWMRTIWKKTLDRPIRAKIINSL